MTALLRPHRSQALLTILHSSAVALVAAVALGGGALADIITLKNGSRIEGLVERTEPGPLCAKCLGKGEVECPSCRGSGRAGPGVRCRGCRGKTRVACRACEGRGRGEKQYVIRLRGGARTTIPEGRVASVVKSHIPPEDLLPPRRSYAARAAKLARGDAAGELALARWALGRGLHAEASKHARSAARADETLAAEARGVYEAAEQKLVGAASHALKAALEEIRAGRLEEGLRALEAARREHERSPVLTDTDRERRFLREHAGDLAARYGETLDEIELSARRNLKLGCGACGGAGTAKCPTCRGTGGGTCPRCRGSGESWCAECNGSSWRLCLSCGGTGKPKRLRLSVQAVCVECRGRGIKNCTHCKKGRTGCQACRAKGKVAGTCKDCGGKGTKPCAGCLGTGLARVTKLRWGPVKEVPGGPAVGREGTRRGERPPVGAEGRVPVWQGVRRGCIITVMRARDLYEGALTAELRAVVGTDLEFLVLCVDNRDGRDQVEFSPEREGLRLVTDDAKQLAAEPPRGVEKLSSERPEFKAVLGGLKPIAVLPGVTANAIAALPAATDFGTVASAYWGREDPLRLKRSYITEDELASIRKTLR